MAHDVSSFSGRLLAYLDMLLVDHGVFRVIYNNLYALPGGLYRSSQPSPGQIRKYQRQLGIKTIINLRDEKREAWYDTESKAAKNNGIRLVDYPLSSSEKVSVEDSETLAAVLRTGMRRVMR